MRRIASIICGLAVAVLAVVGTGAGEGDSYEVRAIFDTGGFLVPGEDVRVAGARVGHVSDVDVTREDEPAHADGSPQPGKAVVVMTIEEPGFQDFREDAECLIRPQSLLGEKFVDCRVTAPRAPGSPPAPELEVIPDGEIGAGQRFLPLEANGKAIDLDLVNNIMKEPYPDRFRLILNDLGAGLAARGDDLAAVIERGNPALRRTDEVLAILAKQNRNLARLARDGDQVLQPLAAERRRIKGFVNNAAVVASASAERGADLRAGLERLPGFLRELELTMNELDEFSTEATPVVSDLGDAAPSLTVATEALGPFSEASTIALKSLGDAADEAGQPLVNSQPLLKQLRNTANKTAPVGRVLKKLLSNLQTRGGYRYLTEVIFGLSAAFNGYDGFGHFLRAMVPVNNCFFPVVAPEASCSSFFTGASKAPKLKTERPQATEPRSAAGGADAPAAGEEGGAEAPDEAFGDEDVPTPPQSEPPPAEEQPSEAKVSRRSTRVLFEYLLGPGQAKGPGR